MNKYAKLILTSCLLIVLCGCNQGNTTDISANYESDGVKATDIEFVVGDKYSEIQGTDVNQAFVESGNVEINNIEQGDINNISEQNVVNIESQNINLYVDKVLTDLVDINGNIVIPFADNAEIYVPLSSLSKIIDMPVEWDRENKAVYVGESPNRKTNMLDIVHGYDPQYITEYSFLENKGTEFFNMAGKKYTDGLVAYSRNTRDASINFNLEGKYNNLSFNFGHLDGTNMFPTKLIIKLDGYLEKEIEIDAEDYPVLIELNVTNAMQLRFELEVTYDTGYAFTDMELT